MLATDLVVGVASHTTRLALIVGEKGWGATITAGRVVSGLPGVTRAGRLLDLAARPLVDDGRDVRGRAQSVLQVGTQRLLQAVVPGAIDALDVDALLKRIDIDALVQRIEIDALVKRIDIDELVSRIDIDALVQRIEIDALVKRIGIDELVSRIDIDALVQRIQIDALVKRIDIDELVGRIDIDALVQGIDVNQVVQRVDVDAVVEETELGTIVARSTSGFASGALDAAREQTAGVDSIVSRAVNRVLRRNDSEVPPGPRLLIGSSDPEDAESAAAPSLPESPEIESQ